MSLEEGIRAHLLADTGVAALVGTRVFHEDLGQNTTYPAVAFARTATERVMTLAGPSGLAQVRVAVDCWADTSAGVKALAAAVLAALHGVTGDLGGTTIQSCACESEADLSEVDGDRRDRRVSLEFVIWLNE